MGPSAHILPDVERLHLQHGPIDLIIHVDGERQKAFEAAHARFQTLLTKLVEELQQLRAPLTQNTRPPSGTVARRMHQAAIPFANEGYLTRMSAVAGAVADEILAAMCAGAKCERAFVNNGGDIALYLAENRHYNAAIMDHRNKPLGQITITAQDHIRGIATSGRHGRSFSLGIADSVTILAKNAALADVAATLCANAVDLPDHQNITRQPACALDDASDLGTLAVVTDCPTLTPNEREKALARGLRLAQRFRDEGHIASAMLNLQGDTEITHNKHFTLQSEEMIYV